MANLMVTCAFDIGNNCAPESHLIQATDSKPAQSVAIFGASRGLGRELAVGFAKRAEVKSILIVARTADQLHRLAVELRRVRARLDDLAVHVLTFDLSKSAKLDVLMHALQEHQVHKVIYAAGGGPYGLFEERPWPSHEWALQVNLLTPAQLLHAALAKKGPQLKQWIFVGSAIAEGAGDPRAASYAAAKHGLVGLYSSLRAESPDFDVRLYSPGYMDTGLLPKSAPQRQTPGLVQPPAQVARDFLTWCFNDRYHGDHRKFTSLSTSLA